MSRIAVLLLLVCGLWPMQASAQSGCPSIAYGAVLTAAQWNQCFASKVDYTGSAALTGILANSPITASTDGSIVTVGLNVGVNFDFTAAQTVNINGATLQAAQTGTALQLANANGTATRIEADAYAASAHFSGVRADGTAASPTTLQSGDNIASFNAFGYNGSAFVGPQAALRCYAAQNWTTGPAYGTYCDVAVTANGGSTLAESVRFENDGGLTLPSTVTGGDKGAGTINAAGLYVNGTAVSVGGVSTFSAGTTGFTPSSATPGAITLAGTLGIANGGTNCAVASITCFNNITSFSAGGSTGTTSTNLVFSGSPTLSGTVGGNLTFGGNIAFSGTITAASLSTPGSIGGSLCATSGGVFLYYASNNCFAASASSITVGTTTVSGGTTALVFYQNGASPTGVIGQISGVSSNGTSMTFANGDLLLAGSSSGAMTLEAPAVASSYVATFQVGTQTIASTTLTGQNLSGGATVTPNNLTAGTSFTVNCGLSPLQWIINNSAFTITAPTAANSQNCAIRVINGTTAANAGAVTIGTAQGWSGKTPGGVTFATTATTSAASISYTNSSANITWASTTPPVNAIVFLANSGGALPTNFSTSTLYYVVSSSGTTVTLSATPGGSAIVAGSAGSGTQTAYVPSIYDLVVDNINSPPYAQWIQVQ